MEYSPSNNSIKSEGLKKQKVFLNTKRIITDNIKPTINGFNVDSKKIKKHKLKEDDVAKFEKNEKNEVNDNDDINSEYDDDLVKSIENNEYNSDLYQFMTDFQNMKFLKPKLMINEHYESFCIKCSETKNTKKNEVHIIKNIFKELYSKFKSYKKNYLIDFNNNLIEKWKIMFKTGIRAKLENLKKYKRRYNLKDIKNEYLFVMKYIFFDINEKNIFNYFWYLYILPKDLLIIILEKIKDNDEFWIELVSDLKNFWIAILRVGGVRPFLMKMNLF